MDVHFNAYKCKYEKLNEWLIPYARSNHIRKVKIFINLDDFFHSLFRPNVNNEFEVCGTDAGKQFLSNIFNLIAHYRYWAIKNKYDVEVYAYYSSGKSFKNGIFVPEYRKKAMQYFELDKYYYVKDAINSAMELVSVIAPYIPKVYVIDTKYLEPSILPLYITEKRGSGDMNILISRDIYDLQYAYRDKWMYISPKGDNSTFVHRGNMWEYINYKEHIYSDKRSFTYPPKLLVFAKSIVGDKYRDIPRLRRVGWKTLFKFIDNLGEKLTEDNYIIIEMKLQEILKGKLVQDSVLQKNLNCVDHQMQVNVMTEIDKAIIDNQLNDIEDFENLKMMNANLLTRYPLNLKFLCDTIQRPASINDWFH